MSCTSFELDSSQSKSNQDIGATTLIHQDNHSISEKKFEGEVWMKTNNQNEATIFSDANSDGIIDLLVILGNAVFPYPYQDSHYSQASVILRDSSATIVNIEGKSEFIFSVDRNIAKYSHLNAKLLTGSMYARLTFGLETSINSGGVPISSFLKKGNGYETYFSIHEFLNNTPLEKIGDGSIIGCTPQSSLYSCDAGGPGSTSCSYSYGSSSSSTICVDNCFACCWLEHINDNIYITKARCFEY